MRPIAVSAAARRVALLTVLAALATALASPLAAQQPGAIRPGMTEAEVRATWGEPLTVRQVGAMTFLYFRNDCPRRCGTHDVVFLEGGQVVDAIVRDSHRRYDGVSSSPVDRKPEATTP
jgi:outer membrane protein assembly factor BamE (lipoprotein component of BamABCDE complex)